MTAPLGILVTTPENLERLLSLSGIHLTTSLGTRAVVPSTLRPGGHRRSEPTQGAASRPSLRGRRASRRHTVEVLGQVHTAEGVAGVLSVVLELLHGLDATFLPRLAEERTSCRRYVARRPEGLYLRSPHLTGHARQFVPGWYVGTNHGARDAERILKVVCRVTGLTYGTDIVTDL